ncbi:methyltransferase domain-containing protein [Nocardiopsis lucentensis]|uniref:rRNA adenine N-6-methyltransferase family protein n=1 Tax=Nocardiopsis lucentensis TaxID=53441 RepID=UPI000348E031|nr:rRNA adenine N-6-methyltransferase family protein [Nocardiopsis lucentensis]
MDELTERRSALVDRLTSRGTLTDPAWRAAMLKVPRHAFLPETVWGEDTAAADGRLTTVVRSHPDWIRWAYDDVSVITQVDDGTPAFPDGRGDRATSSVSQPSLVAEMLQALDVEDGTSVLEIGTATGYNCALLCERSGSENVTSVELDPVLAKQAAANLRLIGYKPHLVVGDGALGVPERAPFDRILATVAARDIPKAWIAQTRPGGVVVTPWATGFATTALLRLVVGEDGTAYGRVLGDAPFMWLRGQRVVPGELRDHVDETAEGVEEFRAGLDSMPVCDADPAGGLALTVGALVPGLSLTRFHATDGSGEASVYFYDRRGSWVLIEYTPGADAYEAYRFGPRDLCAEIEHAVRAWWGAGRPRRDRMGLTVTTEGQRVWIDDPDHELLPPRSGQGWS